jgi:menaquinone-dependent protoporphyrinogen IX oxidase
VNTEQYVWDFLNMIGAADVKRLIKEGRLSVERVAYISASELGKVGYKIDYKGEHEIHIDTDKGEIVVDGESIRDYDLIDEVNDFLDKLFGELGVHPRAKAERTRHLNLA